MNTKTNTPDRAFENSSTGEGLGATPCSANVVTCVYCGHEYPDGTPTAKHQLLTEHIKTCERHPMRDAENKIETLRKALAGLIGAESPEELEAMEAAMRVMPGVEKDKIDALNAIHALQSLQNKEIGGGA